MFKIIISVFTLIRSCRAIKSPIYASHKTVLSSTILETIELCKQRIDVELNYQYPFKTIIPILTFIQVCNASNSPT